MIEPKQKRFCEEYVKDHNATQAAIRAGYSPKTSNEQASRMLAKVSIQDYIKSLQAPITEKCLVDAAWIRESFKNIAERCMQARPIMEYDPIDKCHRHKLSEETGEPLFEFDPNGAARALESLGKHVGFYEKDNTQNGAGVLAEALREFLKS